MLERSVLAFCLLVNLQRYRSFTSPASAGGHLWSTHANWILEEDRRSHFEKLNAAQKCLALQDALTLR